MPPSAIFQSFKKANCVQLFVGVRLPISRSILPKLRGDRRKRPLWFAAAYPGEGKLKIGVAANLKSAGKGSYDLSVRWFATHHDPPPEYGTFTSLVNSLEKTFREREVDVVAQVAFNKEEVISLFTPINIGSQSPILDEIVGFTGIKRDPEGKILYRLEITLSDKLIEQTINFKQTVKLEADMPIPLLATASKISALAVKPKE